MNSMCGECEMPNIIEITSFDAPELDVYVRLTGAQLRNKLEPEKGIFIAESPTVIEVTKCVFAGISYYIFAVILLTLLLIIKQMSKLIEFNMSVKKK